ncbi:hypothetical protein [Sedimentibacter sp. MB31-C6]|uniref:hypothetical protein n=1 Tax=Sedimentibacter sp. MB31-C6 TaxID=3109366 RepID=UPI002DDD23D6|nr:hypothetical protein [Sedimentibacter sp. MB36-C1]WSI05145.1 hypothetical protein U8307_04960 [Sedimentibacter sp. MB36-C1]
MVELNLHDFQNIINNKKCAFLCGNGFSINFDNDYKYIYDSLLKAHKKIIHNAKLEPYPNKISTKVLTDNFNSIKQEMYNYNQFDFDKIFNDGIRFAESILENEEIVKELYKNGLLNDLNFDISQLSLAKNIVTKGRRYGYKYVNIEYWTILIYFYYVIKRVNSEKYQFPSENKFIYLIRVGSKNSNPILGDSGKNLNQFIMTNGFNLYYRTLFSTAILCDGKSVYCSKLTNLNIINKKTLIPFLDSFKILMTLNYDHILEYLTGRDVTHIHGEYIVGKKQYVWYCSLGIEDQGHYISFSDILVGDYFVNKIFASVMNSNMDGIGDIKQTVKFSQSIEKNIRMNNVTHIVIFGMNIDNDQHIIMNIMLSLEDRINQGVGIIYCYHKESDREIFEKEYQKEVITFKNRDVAERVSQIPIYYIKSQDILDNYF